MEENIIGKTLKNIRKGKKLTVRYITNGIITPQHYYKVEKGEAYLSCNYLLQLLDRMNVSYKEFSILINSDNTRKKKCLITIVSMKMISFLETIFSLSITVCETLQHERIF
ncbi:hypothetical protein BH747_06525 [Enterococcus villorum]|uniref:HTH cro/C1-type domain-containing protein n=1 Tax=Enterococcus villorum TaxID=112904 RepID=A0A1V8YCL2_9ENTE|nr:helix-turn-helix transcriptional regulator [Enterococcus villorum]OQO70353.1 hypothetical protein BH747_06525 [Enterococcus villorum]OQO77193.1 hypothetical protein BH744_00510 [Enterococcus villorum]